MKLTEGATSLAALLASMKDLDPERFEREGFQVKVNNEFAELAENMPSSASTLVEFFLSHMADLRTLNSQLFDETVWPKVRNDETTWKKISTNLSYLRDNDKMGYFSVLSRVKQLDREKFREMAGDEAGFKTLWESAMANCQQLQASDQLYYLPVLQTTRPVTVPETALDISSEVWQAMIAKMQEGAARDRHSNDPEEFTRIFYRAKNLAGLNRYRPQGGEYYKKVSW